MWSLHIRPDPWPCAALVLAEEAPVKPSCLQATFASWLPQPLCPQLEIDDSFPKQFNAFIHIGPVPWPWLAPLKTWETLSKPSCLQATRPASMFHPLSQIVPQWLFKKDLYPSSVWMITSYSQCTICQNFERKEDSISADLWFAWNVHQLFNCSIWGSVESYLGLRWIASKSLSSKNFRDKLKKESLWHFEDISKRKCFRL